MPGGIKPPRPTFLAGSASGRPLLISASTFDAIGEMNMELTSQKLVMTCLVWGLAEIVIATIAGAWVYKEA